MIAEIVGSAFVLVIAYMLIRALVSGRIEFNAGGKSMVADRSKEPSSFWAIFLIGVMVVVSFVWLLIP